jgi:hypothetical protein
VFPQYIKQIVVYFLFLKKLVTKLQNMKNTWCLHLEWLVVLAPTMLIEANGASLDGCIIWNNFEIF